MVSNPPPPISVKQVSGPRYHLKLRCQIADIGRPTRTAFVFPQVQMVACPRYRPRFEESESLGRLAAPFLLAGCVAKRNRPKPQNPGVAK